MNEEQITRMENAINEKASKLCNEMKLLKLISNPKMSKRKAWSLNHSSMNITSRMQKLQNMMDKVQDQKKLLIKKN